MKVLGALAGVFLVVVVILSLLTALTSASASLANGVANAAASTALLTSQCLSGFMVIVALVAGAAVGVTGYRFVSGRKTHPELPPHVMPNPYPFVQVQRSKPAGYLPTGERRLPVVYLNEPGQREEAEVEDTLFRNWVW